MAAQGLLAKARIHINADATRVWNALTDPAAIKKYMFGATVRSDWKERSPITWEGEYEGRKFVDKGIVLKAEPGRRIKYSHYSSLSTKPDQPENHHVVEIELEASGEGTVVSLTQNKNTSEKERDHARKNWEQMLASLKEVVEEH